MAASLEDINRKNKERKAAFKRPAAKKEANTAKQLMPWQTFGDAQAGQGPGESSAKGNNKGEQQTNAGTGWAPTQADARLRPDLPSRALDANGNSKGEQWGRAVSDALEAAPAHPAMATEVLSSSSPSKGNNKGEQGEDAEGWDAPDQVASAKGNNKGEQGGDAGTAAGVAAGIPIQPKGNNKGEQQGAGLPQVPHSKLGAQDSGVGEQNVAPLATVPGAQAKGVNALTPKSSVPTAQSKGNNKGEQAEQPHAPAHAEAVTPSQSHPHGTRASNTIAPVASTAKGEQRGTKGNNKGEQHSAQRGTKGNNKGEQATIKEEQPADQRGTDPCSATLGAPIKGEQDPAQRGTKGNNKEEQAAAVPLKSLSRSPLTTPLFPFDRTGTIPTDTVVPLSSALCSSLQRGTIRKSKGEQLPTSTQQRQILFFLAERQVETGLRMTALLRKSEIAEALNIPLESLKVQLKRLRALDLFEVIEARHGRGDAGCVYRVSEAVLELALLRKEEQLALPKGNNKGEQQRGTNPRSSSSFLNTSTTTTPRPLSDRSLSEQFRIALERFRFDDVLGANDVLQAWRSGNFEDPEDLLESVEHLAHYVKDPGTKKLDSPKGFVMSELRKGYYGKPAGFRSWQQREQEAKIAAKEHRAAELKALREKDFDADFELWLADLEAAERTRILRDKLQSASTFVSPSVARSVLRNHYATAKGFFEFVVEDERDD